MKLTDEKIAEMAWEMKISDFRPYPEMDNSSYLLCVRFARAILDEAGVEELERDAERYRWLCRQTYGCDPEPFRLLDDFDSDKQSIDTAIDEARKAK